MGNVADSLWSTNDLNSREFLSDLGRVDELFTSLADAGTRPNTLYYGGYPPNMPPVANDDPYYQTKHDTTRNVLPSEGVLNNDYDPNYGTVLTASLVSGPSHAASFTFNSNGSFTYTPAYHFVGRDTFTYRASDGIANSNLATVTINVSNFGPQAQNDQYTASFRTELVVNPRGVLANDNDLEGDSLSAIKVTDPSHGQRHSQHGRFVPIYARRRLPRSGCIHVQSQRWLERWKRGDGDDQRRSPRTRHRHR